ncbi:MAG: porin family protein [Bradyrhizobium sp.]|nr:porin family protein [Bradyrhizobium sp.]
MKTLALAATLLGLVTGTVMAADLPVKVPPVAPTYNWTGWHVGGNVGYGWGNSDPSNLGIGNSITHTGPFDQSNSFAFGGPQSQKLNGGVIGGGQFGYNYQAGRIWLLGFEADIQAANQRSTSTFLDPIAGTVCESGNALRCTQTRPLIGAAITNYQTKLEWFGTVRGRVGLLVTDQTFFYATGGLAYGNLTASGNVTVSGTEPVLGVAFTGVTSGFGASKTNVGYAAGGGIEGKLTNLLPQNWSWKLEYLYLDLGSVNVATPFVAASNRTAGFTDINGTASYHSRFTDNIVRAGLNYQFH